MTKIDNFIIDNEGITLSDLRESSIDIFNGEIPEHVDISGMKEYKLTKDETISILAYTGSSSRWVNPELRNGKWINDENKVRFVELLDKALIKIKPYTETILYRVGDSCDFKVGQKVKIKSYLSTSIDNFDNSETVWIISPKKEASNSCDIRNVTGHIYEKEIIFKRDTIFKVTKVSDNSIWLDEV